MRSSLGHLAERNGAPGWDRTSDSRLNRQVLYQLSYGRVNDAGLLLRATAGAWANTPTLVDRRGFEPRGTEC